MIYWFIKNNIGHIRIDSPCNNAIGKADLYELKSILINEIHKCKGLIITGSRYSFCSGLNLADGNLDGLLNLLNLILTKLFSLSIPVVCILNGHAIGAGFLLMCCADYIVCVKNDKAKFGLPEVNLGISITELMLKVIKSKIDIATIEKILLYGQLFTTEVLMKYIETIQLRSSSDDAYRISLEYIQNIKYLKTYSQMKLMLRSN